MVEITARVQQVRQEAIDILSFELVPTEGMLPAFTPGSHIDVHPAPGIMRQYSLLNAPGETSAYRIAVKLDPASRGGSRVMHENIRNGQTLSISAPRNNFRLHAGARHTMLFAGGIGITPLLSMLQHLDGVGESYELQYFTRSLAHTAFREFLSQAQFAGKVNFHYALEPEALRVCLQKLLGQRPDGAHMYICGPRPFMDMVELSAAPEWPPESVHLEYFSADPESMAGARDVFAVRCARSGGEYLVPADESIVDALRKHGIVIETSCEQGVCGTCLTGVLEGEPDHRDAYLTDDEKQSGKQMLPCVSRAKSKVLVLDV